MKFPQLAIGARFRWRDALYRKSGPLTAHAEADGSQTMVPRSARVEPVEAGDGGATAGTGAPRRPEAVAAALEAMIRQIEDAAGGLGDQDAARIRTALHEARRGFVERVGL